jgi:serine protein kinase
VVRRYPSILRQIGIAKTEPGDENNQDISSLVGKVDIRKLEQYAQDDADAYSYSGGLCLANQGLLEFVEMFKAPIKVLHPLLTATQEGNFKGTEGFGAIPFDGVILAHSNESDGRRSATTATTRRCSTGSSSSRCRTACACRKRSRSTRS